MRYINNEISKLHERMLIRAKFDKVMRQLLTRALKSSYATSATFEHVEMLESGRILSLLKPLHEEEHYSEEGKGGLEGISLHELNHVAISSFYGWTMSTLAACKSQSSSRPAISTSTSCSTNVILSYKYTFFRWSCCILKAFLIKQNFLL